MKKAIIGCLAIFLTLSLALVGCDTGDGIGGNEAGFLGLPKGSDSTYVFDENGELKSLTGRFTSDGKLSFAAPASKSAGRALSHGTAIASYDFFEVVFVGDAAGSLGVARTQWNFGSAGIISNVQRDSNGIDYTDLTASIGTGVGKAVLFVGNRKNSNLLAIGLLTHIDGIDVSLGSGAELIKDTTKTVTFTVASLVAGINAQSIGNPSLIETSTHPYVCPNAGCDTFELGHATLRTTTNLFTKVTIQIDNIDTTGSEFIGYYMDNDPLAQKTLNYKFSFAGSFSTDTDRFKSIIVNGAAELTPRMNVSFVKSGKTYSIVNTDAESLKAQIVVDATGVDTTAIATGTVPFKITPETNNVGLSSFTYSIPVVALTTTSSSDGVNYYPWVIAPGQGTLNGTLDDNKASSLGGSILLVLGALPKYNNLAQDTIRITQEGIVITPTIPVP